MPIRNEEQIALIETVGAAARNRMPLEVTLAALAEEKADRRLAEVAGNLAQKLAGGATIDQALADLAGKLPPELAGYLRAGMECGDLAATFEQFAQQRLASQRVARRIRAAIAYPILILVILVPLMLFLSLYVIPIFVGIFEEFDLNLPESTLLIIGTAELLPVLVGGVLLMVLLIPLLLRLIGGRWLFHRVRVAVPVMGRFWNWSGQREFAAILASFLDLRLPLTTALRHTSEIISDRNVARACRRVSQRLESGEGLGRSMSHSMHFDRGLASLAMWGEKHNALPDALRIAVEVFDDHIEQHAAVVRRLLPPMALVGVATLMFFVIAGLMIPLIGLIEGLMM